MSLKTLAKEALTFGYSLGGMRKSTSGCRILMYHSIESPVGLDPAGNYTVPLSDFRAQMIWLRNESGLKIVSSNDDLVDGAVAVTFDDGYISYLKYALPVLKELNIPSTIFVTTGFVGKTNNQFLNPLQINSLSKEGLICVGSHSVSHPFLGKCTDKQIESELVASKKFLEDICGNAIESLAYPNGSFSALVVEKARAAGYRLAFSSRNSAAHLHEDRYLLPRTCIFSTDGLKGFKARIYGHHDWHGLLLG
jgi:peptidoglycan/xylan/chitin deacetylase (PgdA/CDA1 family)